MTFAHNMLENTKGGMIAGIGIVILFWSVMKVLGNIEASFNDVWNIKRPRSILRKFSDYLSIMLISPVFIIISSSLNVFITSYIAHAAENGEIMEYFGPALLVLVKFVPYLLIWTLLTVIYLMMPNTKVKFGSGLLAGVIAGTLLQILQWGYINFQVVLSNYNAIYGSFAALPLLLIWLRISWLIILFGAEISFAKQNVHHYEFEADSQNISPAYKRLLSLITSHLLVQNFAKGKHALTTAEISKELEIPIRIVRTILFELHEAGIISETRTESEKESAFQPAKDIHKITIQDIIEALDNNGIDSIKIKISEQKRIISESLVKFNDILKNSEANKLLMEI
ncbi:MAG: YihY/virulence factor BrkB family protein [Marinilabiliales bacterium]|nr:MAG: YihY/virulence factor BrkB family protein [Marinilabiliales bacterium]